MRPVAYMGHLELLAMRDRPTVNMYNQVGHVKRRSCNGASGVAQRPYGYAGVRPPALGDTMWHGYVKLEHTKPLCRGEVDLRLVAHETDLGAYWCSLVERRQDGQLGPRSRGDPPSGRHNCVGPGPLEGIDGNRCPRAAVMEGHGKWYHNGQRDAAVSARQADSRERRRARQRRGQVDQHAWLVGNYKPGHVAGP